MRKRILQLIGILLLGYIVYRIGPINVFNEIRNVRVNLLILTILSIVFVTLLQGLRWQIILKVLDIHISWLQALKLFWIGMFVGAVTPGKVGDFARVYFLRKRNPSTFRAFFSVLVDRMIDVLVLLCCATITALFFLKKIRIHVLIVSVFWLSLFIFLIFLMNKESYIHRLFSNLIKRIVPSSFKDFDGFSFNKFYAGVKSARKIELLLIVCLVIVVWTVSFLSRYFLALSLSINISFIESFFCVSASTIVALLPISVSGIGTREAAMVFMFSQLGLASESAVAFSLLIVVVDLFVISFGIIPYLKSTDIKGKIRGEFNE